MRRPCCRRLTQEKHAFLRAVSESETSQMNNRIVRAAVAASFAGVAFTSVALPASAHASTVRPAVTSTWQWDVRTCNAYWGWREHRTAKRFAYLARTASHADLYLRSDVGDLVNGVRHHDSSLTRSASHWVFVDCTTSPDE